MGWIGRDEDPIQEGCAVTVLRLAANEQVFATITWLCNRHALLDTGMQAGFCLGRAIWILAFYACLHPLRPACLRCQMLHAKDTSDKRMVKLMVFGPVLVIPEGP